MFGKLNCVACQCLLYRISKLTSNIQIFFREAAEHVARTIAPAGSSASPTHHLLCQTNYKLIILFQGKAATSLPRIVIRIIPATPLPTIGIAIIGIPIDALCAVITAAERAARNERDAVGFAFGFHDVFLLKLDDFYVFLTNHNWVVPVSTKTNHSLVREHDREI